MTNAMVKKVRATGQSWPGRHLSSSRARLADRTGLGCLAEQFIQLPGTNGGDKGIDYGRKLVLGRDDDAGLALLELDGLGPELDGHPDLPAGSVFHQGLTACCLVLACRCPSTLVHRWTVRT